MSYGQMDIRYRQQQPIFMASPRLMYKSGFGVTQDNEVAAKWFQLAADQGDIDAKIALAQLHAGG